MTLSVNAYAQLYKIDCVYNEAGEPIDPNTREEIADYVKLYVNTDFAQSRAAPFVNGVYVSKVTESVHFPMGYPTHRVFREALAKLAGYPAVEWERVPDYAPSREMSHFASAWLRAEQTCNLPFYELICFSDCEGTLGTEVCKRLLPEFDRVSAVRGTTPVAMPGGGNFWAIFDNWHKAVRVAADGGAITFN